MMILRFSLFDLSLKLMGRTSRILRYSPLFRVIMPLVMDFMDSHSFVDAVSLDGGVDLDDFLNIISPPEWIFGIEQDDSQMLFHNDNFIYAFA